MISLKNLAVGLVLFFSGWKTVQMPTAFSISEEQCLAACIFFEARGEPKKGMQAVAAVVLNRAKHKNYPETICKVVFQRKQFSWTWQQEYATIYSVLKEDLSDFSSKDRSKYLQAKMIAQSPLKELTKIVPAGTLHFHTVEVSPRWADPKARVGKIGRHLFYKEMQ